MIRLSWGFVYVLVIIFADLSMGSSKDNIDKNVTELFEINWESMRYNKTVTQYNPEVSSNQQPSRADEKLTLNCQVEIKDTSLIFGISRQGNLTEMIDSGGRNIEISQEQPQLSSQSLPPMRNMPTPQSFRMRYEGLRYHQRMSQPPKIPRWRTLLYKYFRIQPRPFKPEFINELEPPRLQFELDLGLLGQSGEEIKSLKGYYYVLMAESIQHIEVPFEPNDQWVGLTDEIAIQVREAECKITGSRLKYNLDIEESRLGGERFNRLSFGDYLPEKMVMGRQLIGKDGKSLDRSMGHGFLPAHVGGSSSGSRSGSDGVVPIEKIRFVIAVNPKHCKIPFELKNIPLPNPELTGNKE